MEKWNDILHRFRKSPYVVPVILVIAALLLLSIFSRESGPSGDKKESFDAYEYVEGLEAKLKKTIGSFSWVEECQVMITLESFENNEYLENSSVSANQSENAEQYSKQREYLVINEEGSDEVILRTRNTPEIGGALIVYKGANNLEAKKNILEAASTVLGLRSNKVCVICE